MSITHKKRGGDSSERLRDKKGRFRKKGKDSKKDLKPKLKRQSSKKQLKKKKLKKQRSEKMKESGSLPIAYGHIYSDSCGHCVNMQNDWDNLVNDVGNKVELCDMGDDHSNQVRQFNDRFHSTLNFSGFPTVFKLSQKNKPVEYYDDYHKKQNDDFENGLSTEKPHPFRSRESMKVWILGG
jgi:hypothetical protein